jgi:hypothetical protein
MIGASVQHTLNFRNLAFKNFYFMAAQVYVCERNLRIAFQCFQKLPEPHQIDIEGRFDHAAIIFSHRLAKSSYPLTNASERFLLWKTGAETRPGETLHQWCIQVPDSRDCPDSGCDLRAAPSGVMRGLDPRIRDSRPCAGHPHLETRKVWVAGASPANTASETLNGESTCRARPSIHGRAESDFDCYLAMPHAGDMVPAWCSRAQCTDVELHIFPVSSTPT